MTPKEGEQSFLDKTQVVRAWLYQRPLLFFISFHSSGRTPFVSFFILFFFVISNNRATTGRHFFSLSFSRQLYFLFTAVVWGSFGFGEFWRQRVLGFCLHVR